MILSWHHSPVRHGTSKVSDECDRLLEGYERPNGQAKTASAGLWSATALLGRVPTLLPGAGPVNAKQ
jgi:hypothetical protein